MHSTLEAVNDHSSVYVKDFAIQAKLKVQSRAARLGLLKQHALPICTPTKFSVHQVADYLDMQDKFIEGF